MYTHTHTHCTVQQEQTDCSAQGMAPMGLLVICPLDQIHMYKPHVTPRLAAYGGH